MKRDAEKVLEDYREAVDRMRVKLTTGRQQMSVVRRLLRHRITCLREEVDLLERLDGFIGQMMPEESLSDD